MRIGYSISKITTFCGLALTHAFREWPDTAAQQPAEQALPLLQISAWITVVWCVVRGLPVLVGSLHRHWGRSNSPLIRVNH
jgi:hypothetical protein